MKKTSKRAGVTSHKPKLELDKERIRGLTVKLAPLSERALGRVAGGDETEAKGVSCSRKVWCC